MSECICTHEPQCRYDGAAMLKIHVRVQAGGGPQAVPEQDFAPFLGFPESSLTAPASLGALAGGSLPQPIQKLEGASFLPFGGWGTDLRSEPGSWGAGPVWEQRLLRDFASGNNAAAASLPCDPTGVLAWALSPAARAPAPSLPACLSLKCLIMK